MKMKASLIFLMLMLLVSSFAPTSVWAIDLSNADSGETVSPFELRPWVDIPLILTATALWTLPTLMDKELHYNSCDVTCDRGDVNAFDATSIGFHSEGSSMASHIGSAGLPLIAGLASLADLSDFGGKAFLEDMVLIAEALTMSGAMQQITRHAFNRPRPYMYINDPDSPMRHNTHEDYRSFFSGHTAAAFSATVAFAYIFSVRRPNNKLKYAIWAFAIAASSAVGVLRVTAGAHFWTDVATGGLLGSAFGILVPAMHLRKSFQENRSVTSSWMITPTSAGLTIRF